MPLRQNQYHHPQKHSTVQGPVILQMKKKSLILILNYSVYNISNCNNLENKLTKQIKLLFQICQ